LDFTDQASGEPVDSWARLSLYESTDLVRGAFKARHGRELSAEKAREIVSAVAQGREYFTAAEAAGPLVSPLLQYYGVLSLSRALSLVLSHNLREASLPPKHGITSVGWGNVLAAPDRHPENLEVQITDGALLSLLGSIGNSEVSTVFTAPYPSQLNIVRAYGIEALGGAKITLRQLLSRIPDLRDIYERSFGESAANYRAFVFMLSADTQTDIDVFGGRHGLPDQEAFRLELSIPADVVLTESARHNFLPDEPHYRYRLLHPGGSNRINLLPQIENSSDEAMAIVTPFAQGVVVPLIGRLFLMSYFLGTFARYHPTSWLSIMQGRKKGDLMLPILREGMGVIQRRFPMLVIRSLEA
jgi:YaaC-like protein